MKEDNTYHDGMDGLNLPESLRVSPFVVPKNYFDELSSSVLSQAHLIQFTERKNTGFTVPESYFSKLTDHIQSQLKMELYRNTAHSEWKVPKGYFEDLSTSILAQTKLETVAKQDEFDVPAGYFENLSVRIQTKIVEDNLKKQVPTDGFTVPDKYTETLTAKILAETVEERKKTPVRSLIFNKWIQYVAAACIALVIGVTSYNSINREPRETFSKSQLTSIPEDEIINYLSASYESQDMLYLMECIDHPHDSEGVCIHVQENDIEDYLNYAL